ncbi:MAG TPA: orotate phosphoribosyltransferase [archaeon]|nr:orotate phosphoribosyltransferase [archaeon]
MAAGRRLLNPSGTSLSGLCNICGGQAKPAYTCNTCGSTVCLSCYQHNIGMCNNCTSRKFR